MNDEHRIELGNVTPANFAEAAAAAGVALVRSYEGTSVHRIGGAARRVEFSRPTANAGARKTRSRLSQLVQLFTRR